MLFSVSLKPAQKFGINATFQAFVNYKKQSVYSVEVLTRYVSYECLVSYHVYKKIVNLYYLGELYMYNVMHLFSGSIGDTV